ncbi:MAG TPA: 50S ribosomal protein L6 [Nitrospiraceae bacterium]|nr:50S ribosomal protein L6 [Nitrospiraceae bacterium]
MSRIGRKPIVVPGGVEVKVAGRNVSVKGPLGQLNWPVVQGLAVSIDNGHVQVTRATDDRKVRALHGLARA